MVEFNKLVKQGIDQSVRRGLLNQIRHGLEMKFPQESEYLFAEIQRVMSLHALKTIENQLFHVKTVEELRAIYRNFM